MSRIASSLGVAALILSSTLPSLAFGSATEFIGHWEGTMVREGAGLEVSFDFKGGPHPSGKFTSLTQKAMDYPLDLLGVNGDAVHFVLGDSLVFDGRLNANQIIGTSTDDGAKGDFSLRRTLAKPPPYDAVDVSFRNGAVTLSGTLCIPRSLVDRAVSSCRVAGAKPAGAPTTLSLIGSPAQEFLHWSMTKEVRALPPAIGKCLLMTT